MENIVYIVIERNNATREEIIRIIYATKEQAEKHIKITEKLLQKENPFSKLYIQEFPVEK